MTEKDSKDENEKNDDKSVSDTYSPHEIAKKVESAGAAKSTLDFYSTGTLAILAGAFISLGGIYFTLATAQITGSYSFTQILGGLAFSVGLILVVVAGAELFTGNNLIVMAFASRKISYVRLLRNWGIVYAGNFLGSLLTAAVLYFTNIWTANNYQFGVRAVLIASNKVNLDFVQAFSLGILCNALVCLAIWLAMGGRSVTDKILAIIFPISAFVAIGFEHSVANMYFIPFALMIKDDPELLSVIQNSDLPVDLSNLDLMGLFSNLLPVSLGNIVGGSLFVGLVYWLIYLRRKA
jgi:formate/nitrite transporter